MKLLAILIVILEAVPLAITARPVRLPGRKQQALAISPPSTLPSSVNSFDGSSDLGSGSSGSTQSSKFHLSDLFAKLNPSSSFRCHSHLQSNTLNNFSIYITKFLRNYRDKIFGGKDESERMTFEICNAGYKSTEVSPAIYFSKMTTRQITKVKEVLENEVIDRFPDMKLVVESNVLAIVQKTGEKLKRRNTI